MTKSKVLLLGWDAADWKVIHPLLDAGKMPNLRRLVETGATGQIATLHPPLSPMLWTSIATGKRPFKHGILGFSEPTPDGRGVQPVTNLSRTCKAVWNILNQNGLRCLVVGWWPSHPAEPIDGVMVSDHFHRTNRPLDQGWPLLANAVHPSKLAQTLADLRTHPDQLRPEMIEPFIPLAREIDQDNDNRLAGCMRTLAECMSVHSAALWLIENQAWDFAAIYYDAIDHFSHGFMKYHPPRQSWIAERDFHLYGNVVSMAYQSHDRMLGDLLQKCGPDTTAILLSDHGFHPDHLRPASIPDIPAGPAIEHRDFGILAMRGPGIRKIDLLHGPSVLDIAPTVLTIYGLPVGADMDGKVLSQALVNAPEVVCIPSWETIPGPDGRHPPHLRIDPVAGHEALEQMIALGYIERPSDDRELAVEKTIRELRYNLAESFQDDDRHREAFAILSELYAADPDEQRFAVRLFVSCQALGMQAEMRRIVEDLDGRRRALFEAAQGWLDTERGGGNESPQCEDQRRELARWRNLARYQPAVVDYLKAQILTAEKRYEEALSALERVTEAHLVRRGLLLQTADLYLRLGRWRDADQVYQKALAIDPDNVHAHIGLCRLALRRRNFSLAAHSALDALQRWERHPLAHFLLGRALTGMHEYERAAAAFRAAISFNPHFPEAHVRLGVLLGKQLGDPASAREHRLLARRMRSRRRVSPAPPPELEETEIAENSDSSLDEAEMPPLAECLVVVTGLPRSGTSMLMQMLAAGGLPVLADGLRQADANNPNGYLEFEAVKRLWQDAKCLCQARGKAVKIVTPLLAAVPRGLPCRVILSRRDLDEVLDSQDRMLATRSSAERRSLLKQEYTRMLDGAKGMLAQRPATQVMAIDHRQALDDPLAAAARLNAFLDGGLDIGMMAGAVGRRCSD